MLGFLIYLPHVVFVPQYLFLLALLYSFLRPCRKLPSVKNCDYLFPTLIVFVSLLVMFVSFFSPDVSTQYSFWFVLIPCTVFLAKNLNKTDLKILYSLFVFESFIVILEYLSGVNSFLVPKEFSQVGTGLLYYSRPFGLGNNSSVAAYNIFFGLLLHEVIAINKYRTGMILKIILMVGIILTFNRTIIVCLVFFYCLKTVLTLKAITYKKLLIGLGVLLVVFSFSFVYWDVISNQMTRNYGVIEMTGRELIWSQFVDFIFEHPFLGNGAAKYYIPWRDGTAHAHNSYLEILATSGFFVFLLYMGLLLSNLNKKNLPFVGSMALAGMSQYIIFWGISIADIMLFYFLFELKNNKVTSLTLAIGR